MITLIDPDTGLAALPEDCYWEVSETTYGYNKAWRMDIKKRVVRKVETKRPFGRVLVHEETDIVKLHGGNVLEMDSYRFAIAPVARIPTKANLRYSSFQILASYREILNNAEQAAKYAEQTQQLLGCYPPNSIN
jgi:hypothetical protein